MPEISKCPSCEKSLLESLDYVAKTANDAVFNVASSESEEEKDEEHKEDDEPGHLENEHDVADLQHEIDSFDEHEYQKVDKMFTEIWGWRRHDVSLH